jgi:hypothetical protein
VLLAHRWEELLRARQRGAALVTRVALRHEFDTKEMIAQLRPPTQAASFIGGS